MRFLGKASRLVCVVTAVVTIGAATGAWAQEAPDTDEPRTEPATVEPVTTTVPEAPPTTDALPAPEATPAAGVPTTTAPAPAARTAPPVAPPAVTAQATSLFRIELDAVPNDPQDVTFTSTQIVGTSFGSPTPFVLDDDGRPSVGGRGRNSFKAFTLPHQVNGQSVAMMFGLGLPPGWSLAGIACSRASDFPPAILFAAQNGNVTCRYTILKRQPDVQVRKSTETSFAGNNVYSPTRTAAQTKAQGIARGKTRTFVYRVQNDGKGADSFTIKGSTAPATAGLVIRYSIGGVDVTADVVAGTKVLGPLAPGAVSPAVVQRITATSTAPKLTRNLDLSATPIAPQPFPKDLATGRIVFS